MANKIQLRGDTAANWLSVNPVLHEREIGITIDGSTPQFKVGDGLTTWEHLPYAAGLVGEAATITIGSVLTGAAGTDVIVTNTGTSNDAILNFTIPVGDSDVLDVTRFGALGDGVTDDTVSVQSCIDYASTHGLKVFVPKGVFLCNNLDLPSNTIIYGAGWDSILKQPQSSDPYAWEALLGTNIATATATLDPDNNVYNIQVSDIQLQGSGGVDRETFVEHLFLFDAFAVTGAHFNRVLFKGWQGDAVYLRGTRDGFYGHNFNINFNACEFDGINQANRQCISIIDVDGMVARDCIFKNSTLDVMPGAIDIEPNSINSNVKNVTIDNNKFENIGGLGAFVLYGLWSQEQLTEPYQNIIITNNKMDNINGDGIHVRQGCRTKYTSTTILHGSATATPSSMTGIYGPEAFISGSQVRVSGPGIGDGTYVSAVTTTTVSFSQVVQAVQTEELYLTGTVTTTGSATVVVTSALLASGPLSFSVAVAPYSAPDYSMANTVQLVAAALNANATFNDTFVATSAFGNQYGILLVSKKTYTGSNDATMNVSIANDTCAGISEIATSTAAVVEGVGGTLILTYEGPALTDACPPLNLHIQNNCMTDIGNIGIFVRGTKGIYVRDNTITSAGAAAIWIGDPLPKDLNIDINIEDNTIMNPTTYGIVLNSNKRINVEHNYIYNALGEFSVWFGGLSNSEYMTVINNVIQRVSATSYPIGVSQTHIMNAATNKCFANRFVGYDITDITTQYMKFPAFITDDATPANVFNSTNLPDSFPNGVSYSVVTTTDSGLPDSIGVGLLKTEKVLTEISGHRGKIIQYFYPDSRYYPKAMYFRKATYNANTWSAWEQFITDMTAVAPGGYGLGVQLEAYGKASVDLNTIRTTGIYLCFDSCTNKPALPSNWATGYMIVLARATSTVKQIYFDEDQHRVATRMCISDTWGSWVEFTPQYFDKRFDTEGLLLSDTDLNNLTTTNLFGVQGTVTNKPSGWDNGFVDVIALDSNNVIQMYYDKATNRTAKRMKVSGTWGAWFTVNMTDPGASASAAVATVGYSLALMAGLWNSPTDGNTYYMGCSVYEPLSDQAIAPVYIMKAGTIKAACVAWSSTNGGSNESINVYLRKNSTTDYFLSSVGTTSTGKLFYNTSLNIAVSVGDYFQAKIVCPTWATNPSAVLLNGQIYIE